MIAVLIFCQIIDGDTWYTFGVMGDSLLFWTEDTFHEHVDELGT